MLGWHDDDDDTANRVRKEGRGEVFTLRVTERWWEKRGKMQRGREEEGGGRRKGKKVGESVQKIANKKYFAPPTAREKELRKRGYR